MSSILAICNITNARKHISYSDVINNQLSIEENAHYNNKMDKKRAALEREINNLKNAILKNERKICDLEAEMTQWQKQQEALDGDYAMCVAKLDMATTKRDKIEIKNEMRMVKSQIERIVNKIKNLRTQLQQCKAKLARQVENLQSLQRKLCKYS